MPLAALVARCATCVPTLAPALPPTAVLGRGTQGVVELARRDGTGLVAIKRTDDARREAELFRHVGAHAHVVQLLELAQNPWSLVLEYGGECLIHAIAREAWDRAHTRRAFAHVTRGVRHLHARCVVHRDLKLENAVIDVRGCTRLIDLGHAHAFASASERTLRARGGTRAYAAPETFDALKSHDAYLADVWSLGILLYVMLTMAFPFASAAPDDLDFRRYRVAQEMRMPPRRALVAACPLPEGALTLLPALVLDLALAVRRTATVERLAATLYVAGVR
jgi:serine/threonine protein kinase